MKKIAQAIISMGVVLAFAGCSWEIPQKVSVKSNADYNFSLGTFEKELDNKMDLTSMMGNTGEGNDNISSYDYFPGERDKNTQQFILEVKVLEQNLLSTIPDESAITTLFGTSETISIGEVFSSGVPTLSSGSATPGNVSLDFNPATMLSGLKEALGEEMAGKIAFTSVPLYLYCSAPENVKADIQLSIFYDTDNTGAHKKGETELLNEDDKTINSPKPVYTTKGSTVITNLNETAYLERKYITNLINSKAEDGTALTLTEDDKLYVSYNISGFTGTVTKQDVRNGLPLTIYAVIALPVEFKALEDVKINVNELTKDLSGGDSSGENNLNNSEFKKYLDIISSVTIRYVAYKLPFYSQSGMKLGVDLVGDGTFQYSNLSVTDKSKKLSESEKPYISLKQETIKKMKDVSTFNPKIQLMMKKDSQFSIPRDKAVEMNLGIGLSTDGEVQIN